MPEKVLQSKCKNEAINNTFLTIAYVLTWYSSNSILLLLNKYLLTFYGYKFPVFLTMCHMMSSGLFSLVAGLSGVFKMQKISSSSQVQKIAVLSMILVASVLCGNISLRFLPVSFNQAIGATTPFFAALLAGSIQGKFEHHATYATLVPVVLGTVIASNGEPNLHFLGLFLCLTATFLRGLKSVIQSILMSGAKNEEKLSSQNLLMVMSPFAMAWLIPFVVCFEPRAFGKTVDLLFVQQKSSFVAIFMLNVTSAYIVNLSNFLVTKQLGALSLQVLGNLKGVVVAGLSIGIFQNPVTPMGLIGYSVTMGGVLLYKEAKKAFGFVSDENQTTKNLNLNNDQKQMILKHLALK